MPYLSVIVPTHNSVNTIEQCLKAIKASLYKDYELIVVDDCSSDGTALVADKYADRLIRSTEHLGRINARNSGIEIASGEIIVNIDSDVLIRPDSLSIIVGHLSDNPGTIAVTGLVAKRCHYKNYFSRYKNLYMNFVFTNLPSEIRFLYGSIYALRRSVITDIIHSANIADDTELGQDIASKGGKIEILKDLQITHLKKYGFLSLAKNDFRIPLEWAKIFVKYKGWQQFICESRFAHSSNIQVSGIIASAAILGLAPFSGMLVYAAIIQSILILIWILLNLSFMKYLAAEEGLGFAALSVVFTFFDNLVMFAGIMSGFLLASRSLLLNKTGSL